MNCDANSPPTLCVDDVVAHEWRSGQELSLEHACVPMESNRTLAVRASSRRITALASSMTPIHLAPRDCSSSVDIPSVLASSPLFSLSVCRPSSVIPTQAARAPFSNISSTLVPPNNSTHWLGLRAGEPANVQGGIPK